MARGDAQIRLRIPHDLRDQVQAIAETNRRTMNQEIVSIIMDALNEDNKPDTSITGRRYQQQTLIRTPDGLRDKLKDAAAQNSRSLNSEIVYRLLASFEKEEA